MEQHNIAYSLPDDQWLLSDILDKWGYKLMASHVRRETNGNILNNYVKLIEAKALRTQDLEALERLYFAGLIYV